MPGRGRHVYATAPILYCYSNSAIENSVRQRHLFTPPATTVRSAILPSSMPADRAAPAAVAPRLAHAAASRRYARQVRCLYGYSRAAGAAARLVRPSAMPPPQRRRVSPSLPPASIIPPRVLLQAESVLVLYLKLSFYERLQDARRESYALFAGEVRAAA